MSRIKSSFHHNTVIIAHDLHVNLLNMTFSWGNESKDDVKAQCGTHKMRGISHFPSVDLTHVVVHAQLFTMRN